MMTMLLVASCGLPKWSLAMTLKADILSRFSGEADERPLYLPDLTLWYEWHQKKDTLPDKWKGYSLPQIAQAMDTPVWLVTRPWRIETTGVEIVTTEQEGERIIRSKTSAGILFARWTLGPDGDWWQVEYPVKSLEDLPAAVELIEARTYVLDSTKLAQLETMVGDDGIVAIEIPRRPYSDLLHELVGWGEGLMLLGEPGISEINAILETKLQQFMPELAQLPGQIFFSPDNLDGQFISPPIFEEYLAESYRLTAEMLHTQGKYLLVHVGGPIKHLLAPLAEVGVDGLEGIAGIPQSNASLTSAREITGPEMTLWGGIPQDLLLNTHDEQAFEAAVRQAVQETLEDKRMILGVADRVPVEAEPSRLETIPLLIKRA
jgi:hypothetical protein